MANWLQTTRLHRFHRMLSLDISMLTGPAAANQEAAGLEAASGFRYKLAHFYAVV
jgi:hypothetical protein